MEYTRAIEKIVLDLLVIIASESPQICLSGIWRLGSPPIGIRVGSGAPNPIFDSTRYVVFSGIDRDTSFCGRAEAVHAR